ncbi:MAG: DUF5623 domain-containing protein [Litorimonas sp.]
MLDTLRPKTLTGIKTLARDIKRRDGLTQTDALEAAARQSGFPNYHAARKRLAYSTGSALNFVTVHWSGRNEEGRFKAGRKSLHLPLNAYIGDLFTRYEVQMMGATRGTRLAARDHVVVRSVCEKPDQAEEVAMDVARRLIFMQETGLRPPVGPNRAPDDAYFWPKVPHQDHVREWRHGPSGAFVMTDEPYKAAIATDEDNTDRQNWEAGSGWSIHPTSFVGLWNRGMTAFELVVPKTASRIVSDLIGTTEDLDRMLAARTWEFEDGLNGEPFQTACTSPSQLRRSMPDATRYALPSAKTVPMAWHADSKRRPNGIMPLEMHIRIGRIFKAVRHTRNLWDGYNRLGRARSDLEDWMFHEHRDDPNDEADVDVYYGGIDNDDPFIDQARTVSGAAEMFEEAIRLLKAHYPDSRPLRETVRRIEMTIPIIRKRTIEEAI